MVSKQTQHDDVSQKSRIATTSLRDEITAVQDEESRFLIIVGGNLIGVIVFIVGVGFFR